MSGRRSVGIASIACIALSALGFFRWSNAVPTVGDQSIHILSVTSSSGDSVETMVAESEDLIVSNDPFRLTNTPSSVRYDPKAENNAAAIATAAPVRPSLTLKAIVGGPPWQAIVDGIPGQPQGTIVRVGNAFDKLIVRVVSRDSVVIQGPDTTWMLGFRKRL